VSVVLQVDGLHAGYGRVPVLRDVSLKVEQGEFVALLGANGVGKSTLLKTIAGLLRSVSGTVSLDGRDITSERAEAIARLGVGLVPEGRQLFGSMSVIDNLLLGAHGIRRQRSEVARRLDHVLALFPPLADRQRQRADSMSGGEQQMLAIGRCIMAQPKVVLLDEPSLGLAPLVVDKLFVTVEALRATGTTFVVVEQNALMTLRYAARAYVLDRGRVVLAGTADEIAASTAIREAYLGVPAESGAVT
jgi:branched-chain amino acid transport system ATP-binding protein